MGLIIKQKGNDVEYYCNGCKKELYPYKFLPGEFTDSRYENGFPSKCFCCFCGEELLVEVKIIKFVLKVDKHIYCSD